MKGSRGGESKVGAPPASARPACVEGLVVPFDSGALEETFHPMTTIGPPVRETEFPAAPPLASASLPTAVPVPDPRRSRRQRMLVSGWTVRGALWVGAVAAAILASSVPAPLPRVADADLARLMHAMAALKGVLLFLGAGALHWRLGRPTPLSFAVGYVASTAALSAMLVMIWRMTHVGLVAIGFHAAIVMVVAFAWADADFIPDPRTTRR